MNKLYAKIGKACDLRSELYYTLVLKYKYFPGDVKWFEYKYVTFIYDKKFQHDLCSYNNIGIVKCKH